jgi:Zn-dependent M28 family amino/carboxypeptidase
MHRLFCLLTCLTVAVACANGDAETPTDEAPTALDRRFDADAAWKHLEAQVAIGPRHAGSEGAERTRKYLEAELRKAELEPVRETFKAQTPVGSIEFANVYADLVGTGGDAQPIFVIASHYDTKRLGDDFVGANDGGSSTAVVLELARVMAAAPRRPVTYRFVFFDGEEAVNHQWRDPDNRYGSRHHVAGLVKSGLSERVKLCVLLDLVGDKKLKFTYDENSDKEVIRVFEQAALEGRLSKHLWARKMPVSDDHISFSEGLAIPVIDLIDFEYGPNNSYWHTNADTLDKCSKESLLVSGRLVLLALPGLEARFGR